MDAAANSTTHSGSEQAAQPHGSKLATRWAQGRRRITPWAYPYLRVLGAVRLTVGIFLVVVAGLLIAHGDESWIAIPLIGAALCLTIGSLDTAAARAARPHT